MAPGEHELDTPGVMDLKAPSEHCVSHVVCSFITLTFGIEICFLLFTILKLIFWFQALYFNFEIMKNVIIEIMKFHLYRIIFL